MTDHLPASHPEVKKPKIGVLLANLGTPDNYDYWSMRRYLSEFLSDKRVVDVPNWKWQPILQLIILSFRPFKSGKAYESIWNHEAGESPLLTITKEQTLAMSDAMEKRYGSEVVVDFCMRYGNPSVESVVQNLLDQGCQKILFVPLYPQYAGATSATANDQLFRASMKVKWQPAVRTITPYFDQPAYIDALAKSVETAYGKLEKRPDILLCSYHGVPKRYLLEGDPYHCHCQKTTRLLMERLEWDETEIKTTFQSIFGREEWLKPYTVEEVKRLAEEEGKTNIAVIAPAFSADCIETLEEINEEIRESFEEGGGKEFTYIPCLNDNPDHIEALAAVVDQNLAGWI